MVMPLIIDLSYQVLHNNISSKNLCSSIQVLYFIPFNVKQCIIAWSYNRLTILVYSSLLVYSMMKSLIIPYNTKFHIKIIVFYSILARLDSSIIGLS